MTPEQAPDGVREAVKKEMNNINKQVEKRAFRIGNALRNAELEVLKGQRSGKRYRKPHTKRATYQASAPGEPPAVGPTKYLRRSFRPKKQITPKADNEISMCAYIESDAPYAGYLENGTSRMAARPYVEKIKEKALPEIDKIIGEIGTDR